MEDKIYLMMNKPAGYVCSAVSDRHKTVYQLLPQEYQDLMKAKRGTRLHTIGRLDCETTGLLLFTTDGEFSNYLTRPESHVQKTYMAVLEKSMTLQDQSAMTELFSKPMLIPSDKKSPEQWVAGTDLVFKCPNLAILTIKEGKFHQVRRMFFSAGNPVVSLHRLSFGPYILPPDLSEGQWRIFSLNSPSTVR